MTEVEIAPTATLPTSAEYTEYWNGPPPPYALMPVRQPFWRARSTWAALTFVTIALAVIYLGLLAAGAFAAAPGGCGGG